MLFHALPLGLFLPFSANSTVHCLVLVRLENKHQRLSEQKKEERDLREEHGREFSITEDLLTSFSVQVVKEEVLTSMPAERKNLLERSKIDLWDNILKNGRVIRYRIYLRFCCNYLFYEIHFVDSYLFHES